MFLEKRITSYLLFLMAIYLEFLLSCLRFIYFFNVFINLECLLSCLLLIYFMFLYTWNVYYVVHFLFIFLCFLHLKCLLSCLFLGFLRLTPIISELRFKIAISKLRFLLS